MHHRMTKAWGGGLLAAALLAIVSVLALAPSATRVHASDERLTSTVAQSAFTDDCNDDAKKNTQECKDKAAKDKSDKEKSNSSNGSQGSRGEKVTLCHATGSASNPYVMITISVNGLHGHDGHAGDIIPAPAAGCPGSALSTTTAGVTITSTSTSTAPVIRETRGIEFIVYTVNGQPATLVLLQALPQDTLVWQVGNMLYTAPAGSVPAAIQTTLIPEIGPSLTAGQFAASVQVGSAPLPAATGSAGLLDEQSTGMAWLLLPMLLIGATGTQVATRKR